MIITILRKPLEGSVADNALKHGCGALNIDATRVGTDGGTKSSEQSPYPKKSDGTEDRSGSWARTGHTSVDINAGRWPANFILTHLEGCVLRGTKKVKGSVGKDSEGNEAKTGISMNNSTGGIHRVSHAGEDGKETVADWVCVEGCPVKELDSQSGVSKSTGGRIGNAQGVYSNQGRTGWGTGHKKADPGFGDEGGASRFFKQFQKENN